MQVKIVATSEEKNHAYLIRRKVFIEEQHVPESEEIDEFENAATHFVLYDEEIPVGAGRLRLIDGIGKVERICVLSSERGKHGGKYLMGKIEEHARKQNIQKTKLNAQTHAEEFYKKLGYETVSGVFMDAGIPHVTMIKSL